MQASEFFAQIKEPATYAMIVMRLKHAVFMKKAQKANIIRKLEPMLLSQEYLFQKDDSYILYLKRHDKLQLMEWIEQLDDLLEQFDQLHAAIGICFLADAKDFHTAYSQALLALCNSPDYDKYTTSYEFFNAAMLEQLQQQEALYHQLHTALRRKEFCINLQPKVKTTDKKLVGAEALLRLYHHEEIIPLTNFMPLCNDNAFIRELDLFVIDQVGTLLEDCKNKGLPLYPISVNISPASYLDGRYYTSQVKEILARHKIPASLIEFELSEDIMFQQKASLKFFLNELQKEGHRISLDDFGSGYSSLLQLCDFAVDSIKLDQQFFTPPFSNRKQLLVASLIEMLHKLSYTIIAEGVETQDVYDFLKHQHCEQIQGYYFSKPLTIEQYKHILQKQNQDLIAL